MVLIGNDNGRMRDNDFKFPSPCGDYGSYQKEAIRYHIEHMDEFPSPCGDYGSYHLKRRNRGLNIMGPLSRPRSKILRVAVSRIILSSEASKVKLVGNLVA